MGGFINGMLLACFVQNAAVRQMEVFFSHPPVTNRAISRLVGPLVMVVVVALLLLISVERVSPVIQGCGTVDLPKAGPDAQ